MVKLSMVIKIVSRLIFASPYSIGWFLHRNGTSKVIGMYASSHFARRSKMEK